MVDSGGGEITYAQLGPSKDKVDHVVKLAAEIGTRPAARRLGISKDTVTRYLQLAKGPEPSQLTLVVRRTTLSRNNADRLAQGYVARATGRVRLAHGKDRRSVTFSVTVEALTLREVLEAIVHQAYAAARKKTGREPGDITITTTSSLK